MNFILNLINSSTSTPSDESHSTDGSEMSNYEQKKEVERVEPIRWSSVMTSPMIEDIQETSTQSEETNSKNQVDDPFLEEIKESEQRKRNAWITRTEPSNGPILLPPYDKSYDHFQNEGLLFHFGYSRVHIPQELLPLMLFFQRRCIELFTQRELRMSKVIRVNDWFTIDIKCEETPLQLHLVQLQRENALLVKHC